MSNDYTIYTQQEISNEVSVIFLQKKKGVEMFVGKLEYNPTFVSVAKAVLNIKLPQAKAMGLMVIFSFYNLFRPHFKNWVWVWPKDINI